MEYVLSCSRQGCDRAPMKRVDKRNDRVAALAVAVKAVFARRLDHALVRLRAGVGKEYLFCKRALAQQLGQIDHGPGIVEV